MTGPPSKLPMQHRSMTVERSDHLERAKGGAEEVIGVSLSSETTVHRWFGSEILSHDKESIDLTYARNGLPFLMDHDTREQIGIIEDIHIAKNRTLRGTLREGSNPQAAHVFADIRNGIRRNISVGYRVNAMQLESSDKNGDTYRATNWTPLEASTVPIPADITVGVGRGAEEDYPVTIHHKQTRGNIMDENGNTETSVGRDRAAEFAALANIGSMGKTDIASVQDAFRRKITPAQYAQEVSDGIISAAARAPSSALQLTERESRTYSLSRVLAAQIAAMQGKADAWKHAGFEHEVSDAIAKTAVRNNGGTFIPMSLRTPVTGNVAGTTSLGGAGVQTSVLELIELLRNRMVVRQAGARVLTGLSSNVTFPRQFTANTLNWTGENPSTGNTNTAATFDNVTLTPKTAMVSTAVSRQMVIQGTNDTEAILRDDLVTLAALGLDLAAIDGTGAASQPTGVMRAGVNTVTTTFGANGAIPDWPAVVQFETNLAAGNVPEGGWKWITTPGIRGKLKQTLKNTVSGAQYIWGDDGRLAGYEALVSNQMPSNYTAGTSTTICHGMILGNWAELLIGEFGGGIEVLVDPYTIASQNMIQFHCFMLADIGVRHLASFALTKAAKLV